MVTSRWSALERRQTLRAAMSLCRKGGGTAKGEHLAATFVNSMHVVLYFLRCGIVWVVHAELYHRIMYIYIFTRGKLHFTSQQVVLLDFFVVDSLGTEFD